MPDAEERAERDALLAEIYAAFTGVTRERGVSWSERDVIDTYGSDDECAAARARDADTRWEDLIDDPSWEFSGCADFAFLDPIGCRYYLAPAMVRSIRKGADIGIQSALTPRSWFERDLGFVLAGPGLHINALPDTRGPGEYFLSQWSLLDKRQRRCVAWFVRFMTEQPIDNAGEAAGWQVAYNQYWRAFAP